MTSGHRIPAVLSYRPGATETPPPRITDIDPLSTLVRDPSPIICSHVPRCFVHYRYAPPCFSPLWQVAVRAIDLDFACPDNDARYLQTRRAPGTAGERPRDAAVILSVVLVPHAHRAERRLSSNRTRMAESRSAKLAVRADMRKLGLMAPVRSSRTGLEPACPVHARLADAVRVVMCGSTRLATQTATTHCSLEEQGPGCAYRREWFALPGLAVNSRRGARRDPSRPIREMLRDSWQ